MLKWMRPLRLSLAVKCTLLFVSALVLIIGAALFVRFSLSRYLRFWLIREIYEQRVQTDRVVESLGNVENLLRAATRPRTKTD